MSNDTFDTNQIRTWDKPQLKNSTETPTPVHSTNLPMGITGLDVDRKSNLRIQAFMDGAAKDSECNKKATVHLDSWYDTVLYYAGCTWLDVCKHDRDFQHGSYSTGGMSDNPGKPSLQVTFEKPYASPPKIVVWLKCLDVGNNANCRVKAHASEITATGFKLSVETWGDTTLHKATATWIAHPANRTNIASGNFNTMDVRAWDKPQLQNGKSIKFDKPFERPPSRVLVALNWLDVSNATNMRIKVLTKDIRAQGMTLNIDSWFDTTLYSAGVSYLAIQDY